MAIGPSLRATLAKYVPTWLGNVPGLRRLYSILWTTALLGDGLREIAWQGQLAAMPGVGTTTALPLIAASRGLVQGPLEPDATFAKRCLNWLEAVALMGFPAGIVTQVQAYLISQGSLGVGNLPTVAFVDRAGNMTAISSSGVITRSTVSWDWDEIGGWVNGDGYLGPLTVEQRWTDGWVLIQDPYTHYTGFSDANWLAAWNSGDQTVDSLTPQQVVGGVTSIVSAWRGAHVYIRCVVWCPDPLTFTPTGKYGNASLNVAGTQTAQRAVGDSYWEPLNGAM